MYDPNALEALHGPYDGLWLEILSPAHRLYVRADAAAPRANLDELQALQVDARDYFDVVELHRRDESWQRDDAVIGFYAPTRVTSRTGRNELVLQWIRLEAELV